MRPLLIALLLTASACGIPNHAAAQPTATTAQVLTADSTIGALMDNPRTRAVIERHMPNLSSNPHLAMIRDWPLRRLATDPHARGLSTEALARIEAELATAQR